MSKLASNRKSKAPGIAWAGLAVSDVPCPLTMHFLSDRRLYNHSYLDSHDQRSPIHPTPQHSLQWRLRFLERIPMNQELVQLPDPLKPFSSFSHTLTPS
jgi:hypothetical protein